MKYKIKKGDTLSQIAQDMGVSMAAIVKANKIKDVDKIYAGRTLTIPGVGKEKVSEKIEVKESYALCRCGQSNKQPMCDGTHKSCNFKG